MSKKSIKDILQAPKGMRDFFGEEYTKRKNFFRVAESIAERYGFSGIETPIMEHTEIFNKGIGEGTDIVDKEMYNLETSGGDRLTLRPEGTASIMRSYIEHGMGSLPQPLLFHYSGPFFRHEKPQKGRYRQLYQFGLEIMGAKNPIYDGLIIQTGYEILCKTKKDIVVGINTLGSKSERTEFIKKLSDFYTKNETEIADSDRRRIVSNPLRILDSKEIETKKINESAPKLWDSLGKDSKDYFNAVLSQLDALAIHYKVIPELVRGLDYYEHTVFEFSTQDVQGNQTLALGGGGRYDGLAETMGHNRSVPSVGLGLGADRTIEVAKKDAFSDIQTDKKFFMISLDTAGFKKSVALSRILSSAGLSVLLHASDNKIGKQFEKAETLGYTYVLLLGENELLRNIILLKNLRTREQFEINIDTLVDELQKI